MMSTALLPKRPQRPASAPAQRPASSRPQSANRQFRVAAPMEDEVRPPPLYELPWHLSTPLERQFARAVGLKDGTSSLRLPGDVEACNRGGHCCWRWLARAAVERVLDESVSHITLGEAVNNARQEVKDMRSISDCRKEYIMLLAKAEHDGDQVEHLEKKVRGMEAELEEFLNMRENMVKAQYDKDALQNETERHLATIRGLEKVVSALQAQQRAIVQGDLAIARRRAEEAESKVTRQDRAIDEFNRQAVRDAAQLHDARATIAKLQSQVSRVRPRKQTKSPGAGRAQSAGRRN